MKAEAQLSHHIVLSDVYGDDGTVMGFKVRTPIQEPDITPFAPKIGSGDVGYSDGTINQVWRKSSFTHGFGHHRMDDNEAYSWSEHAIDSRFRHALMLATIPVDSSYAGAQQVYNFVEHGGLPYALTHVGVYKWGGSSWAITGQTTGRCHDGFSDGARLWVTMNAARGRVWNGAAWANIGDGEVTFTDMRLIVPAGGYIWACDDAGHLIHYTSGPSATYPNSDFEGGSTDPNHIKIGPPGQDIVAMLPFQNALYVATKAGMYWVPNDIPSNLAYQWQGFDQEPHTYNFKAITTFSNALLFTIKNSIWRYAGQSQVKVTPPAYGASMPYKQYGNYRFFTTVGEYLYAVATEDFQTTTLGSHTLGYGPLGYSGTRDVLLVFDGAFWHRLLELTYPNSGSSVTAMFYSPGTDMLWYATSETGPTYKIFYIELQSASNYPVANFETMSTGAHDGGDDAATLTDSTADFRGKYQVGNNLIGETIKNLTDGSEGTITANDATTITATLAGGTENDWDDDDEYIIAAPSGRDNPHYLYLSRFDAGMPTVYKRFVGLSVEGIKSPTMPIAIDYSLDGQGWTTLFTFDSATEHTQRLEFPSAGNEAIAKYIELRVNLQTSDSTATPVLESILLHYIPRPDKVHSWNLSLEIGDDQQTTDGRVQHYTGHQQYMFLKRLNESRKSIELYDPWGHKHNCYMASFNFIVAQTPDPNDVGFPEAELASGAPKPVEGYADIVMVIADNEADTWRDLDDSLLE